MKFKRSAFGYNTNDVEDYIDELAERHEVELEHKDIEIRKLKSNLEQLQIRADEFDEATKRLEELQDMNAQLNSRLSESTQFSSEFARVKADFQAMDSMLREKEQRLQEALTEVSDVRGRAADLPRMESLLMEKDRLLNQAEIEIQSTRRELEAIEGLRSALSDKENTISELKSRIGSLESELEDMSNMPMGHTEAAPTADPGAPVDITPYQGQVSAPIDEVTNYLSTLVLETGTAVIQKNTPEYERFRKMTLALRQHLGSITNELSTYKQQEKAISQALVQAQLKAVEIEAEALSGSLRKKAELADELDASMAELALTKKTTNKFKADLANVIEAYKLRLSNFGLSDNLPPIDGPDDTEEGK